MKGLLFLTGPKEVEHRSVEKKKGVLIKVGQRKKEEKAARRKETEERAFEIVF